MVSILTNNRISILIKEFYFFDKVMVERHRPVGDHEEKEDKNHSHLI